MVDISSHQVVTTIPVGKEPEGITINQSNHAAIVANHKDNTVSVIDLINYNVIKTIPVGGEPKDVAIDSELNIGLVANEKGTGENEDHYTVSVIDLNTYQAIGSVSVGEKPQAIDINPETHLAAVTNEKDNSITVINLLNWQTTTIPIGKHPIDIAINQLDNRVLVVCDEDRSLLLIDLNTNVVLRTYSLNKLPKGVAVNNFTNIAAIVDDKTDSLTLIQLPNPVPQITSINPDTLIRGSKATNIIIEGSGFIKSSVVSFLYATPCTLHADFIDNHHLEVEIPESLLARAGTYQITVTNPSPDGGTSSPINLQINNPVPSISALDPIETKAGTQSLVLSIYGAGFFGDTEIYFGNTEKSIVYIGNTKLQLQLTSEDLKTAGQYEIFAYNLPPGGGNSNKAIFTVKPSLEVKITSPTDGDTVNRAKILVKGTFKSETKDVGITVNGTIAEIYSNEWIANDIPLSIGSNTITATATDSSGNKDIKTITIYSNDTTQQVELSANIISGIAPLQISFSVSTGISNPIVSYQMDFEGDGVIDDAYSSFDNVSHTYTTEGIFYPTVTITDNQGNTYSDTIAITVLSKTEIDTLLKEKWEGMKGALANKDVEKAVGFFADDRKDMYRYNFNLMNSLLPTLIKDMGDIRLIRITDDVAEYEMLAIQDGVEYSFYVEFVKDANGVWKLRFF